MKLRAAAVLPAPTIVRCTPAGGRGIPADPCLRCGSAETARWGWKDLSTSPLLCRVSRTYMLATQAGSARGPTSYRLWAGPCSTRARPPGVCVICIMPPLLSLIHAYDCNVMLHLTHAAQELPRELPRRTPFSDPLISAASCQDKHAHEP
jgi:hypothetical protein